MVFMKVLALDSIFLENFLRFSNCLFLRLSAERAGVYGLAELAIAPFLFAVFLARRPPPIFSIDQKKKPSAWPA